MPIESVNLLRAPLRLGFGWRGGGLLGDLLWLRWRRDERQDGGCSTAVLGKKKWQRVLWYVAFCGGNNGVGASSVSDGPKCLGAEGSGGCAEVEMFLRLDWNGDCVLLPGLESRELLSPSTPSTLQTARLLAVLVQLR